MLHVLPVKDARVHMDRNLDSTVYYTVDSVLGTQCTRYTVYYQDCIIQTLSSVREPHFVYYKTVEIIFSKNLFRTIGKFLSGSFEGLRT